MAHLCDREGVSLEARLVRGEEDREVRIVSESEIVFVEIPTLELRLRTWSKGAADSAGRGRGTDAGAPREVTQPADGTGEISVTEGTGTY